MKSLNFVLFFIFIITAKAYFVLEEADDTLETPSNDKANENLMTSTRFIPSYTRTTNIPVATTQPNRISRRDASEKVVTVKGNIQFRDISATATVTVPFDVNDVKMNCYTPCSSYYSYKDMDSFCDKIGENEISCYNRYISNNTIIDMNEYFNYLNNSNTVCIKKDGMEIYSSGKRTVKDVNDLCSREVRTCDIYIRKNEVTTIGPKDTFVTYVTDYSYPAIATISPDVIDTTFDCVPVVPNMRLKDKICNEISETESSCYEYDSEAIIDYRDVVGSSCGLYIKKSEDSNPITSTTSDGTVTVTVMETVESFVTEQRVATVTVTEKVTLCQIINN